MTVTSRQPSPLQPPVQDGLGVPILMYHQVTPSPHPAYRKYAITPDAFAAQVRWLARNRYVPLRLGEVLRNTCVAPPARPVVITFDDGFQDCIDHAVPILQAHGFTATFFLVAGLVGKSSRWLVEERGLEYRMFDWSAARQLLDHGFECGAHSLTHPHLAEIAPEACLRELRDSKATLEDALGQPVPHVAYPFGSVNEQVRDIAAACGYQSGCTVRIGVASPQSDPLLLPRVPVNGTEGMNGFTSSLGARATAWEVAQRKAKRWWRAVGLNRGIA